MTWLGKLIGGAFGFLMGGPLGALLGTALGHQYDAGGKRPQHTDPRLDDTDRSRAQMAFFTATFSVMGHLAKIDGHVSRAEIDAARAVMDRLELSEDLRRTAIRLFMDGKKPDFPLNKALDPLRVEGRRRQALIIRFIEILVESAYADGPLHPAKEALLLEICDRIHLSRFDFFAIKARVEVERRLGRTAYRRTRHRHEPTPPRMPSIEEDYAVLGLRPTATDSEIKRAYRRLIGQYHPDRMVAAGVPEDKVRRATEKTQQVRKAYERIAEVRKL